MKKKMVMLFLAASMVLTACGSKEDSQNQTTQPAQQTQTKNNDSQSPQDIPLPETVNLGQDQKYSDILQDGTYYIRHVDGTCEPVYFGNGSFESGDISTSPSNNRILWYKEDFNKIPTMYKGDSLILYATGELSEEFILERFEDFGYSIGVRGMLVSVSGRFKIPTQETYITYPGGDTEQISTLTNARVIFESLGGQQLRYNEETQETEGELENTENDALLTRVGTIQNLVKGNNYSAQIFDGTVEYDYDFVADVRILGSMEVSKSNNFSFEDETIINVPVPDDYNSGYYMINGNGLFRYVNDTSFNDFTDFNIPNINTETEQVYLSDLFEKNPSEWTEEEILTQIENGYITEEEAQKLFKDLDTKQKADEIANAGLVQHIDYDNSFSLTKEGKVNVKITFTVAEGAEQKEVDISKVSAVLVSPSGETKLQMRKSGQTLTLDFDATEVGIYQIMYYDLGVNIPKITVESEGTSLDNEEAQTDESVKTDEMQKTDN